MFPAHSHTYVAMKPETTKGSAPASDVAASDSVYIENFDMSVAKEVQDRTGRTGYKAGMAPRVLGARPTWSGEMEMGTYNITGSGDLPHEHPVLLAGGMGTPTYAQDTSAGGGADTLDTQTYTLQSAPSAGISIKQWFFNRGDSNGWVKTIRGAICDLDFNLTPDEVWRVIAKNGQGMSGSVAAAGAGRSADETYAGLGKPVTGTSALFALRALGTTYADVFPTTAYVHSLKVMLNSGAVGEDVLGGRVTRHENGDLGAFEMVIEVQDAADFDIWAMMDNATALQFRCINPTNTAMTFGGLGTSDVPTNSQAGRYIMHKGTGFIKTCTDTQTAKGARIWTIAGTLGYPQTSAAGNGDAGFEPAEVYSVTYGELTV